MKELVEVIAKALVDNPDEVVVTEEREKNSVLVTLHVAQSDMGKVIGKQGRIAKALRTVVKAAATKDDRKVNVDLISDVEAAAQAASETAKAAEEAAVCE